MFAVSTYIPAPLPHGPVLVTRYAPTAEAAAAIAPTDPFGFFTPEVREVDAPTAFAPLRPWAPPPIDPSAWRAALAAPPALSATFRSAKKSRRRDWVVDADTF